ncbi:MAG: 30S ribosomal protein S13 [Promethearchaeota archaeon]
MPQDIKKNYNPEFYQKVPEFRNLLRVIGTSIEGHRTLGFGLSQIRGVGRRLAQAIIRIAQDTDPTLDPRMRIGLITEEQEETLVKMIKDPVAYGVPTWMINRQKDLRTGENRHISGTDVELVLKMDIDRMKRTRSWKGIRHMYGLKVRGQRTRCTGRRGLVVGYFRQKRGA